MDLNRLRHILAVARTRSFSRAAEEESITQPALSRSIAAFEARYKISLFDRGRRGAHPTPAGMLVIDRARKLIAAADDLERNLELYGKGEAGRVAIGLGPLLASLILPELGKVVFKARPGLHIVTVTRSPYRLIPDLLNDEIEMIIGNSWQLAQVPGVEVEQIGKFKLMLLARGDHPLASKSSVTLADLTPYPVANAVEMPMRGLDHHSGSFVCENYHILRDTVMATDCLCVIAPAFVAQEIEQGKLVEIEVSDMPFNETDVSLAFRRGQPRSPAAQAVSDAVRDILMRADQSGTVN